MSLLRKIAHGVTDDDVYRRVGWMYASFFLLFVPVAILSYLLLPEGILRGKHPIVSGLELSPSLWTSTLQIFGVNLITIFLIIAANLFAHQFSKEQSVPLGYFAFW